VTTIDMTAANTAAVEAAPFAYPDEIVQKIVAAAATAIEAAVREQIAQDIEAQRQPITVHIDYPDVAWDAARKSSARIARGVS
jgi:hypothetical protein